MTRDELVVAAYDNGKRTMRDVGREFGISHERVSQILHRFPRNRKPSPIPHHMRYAYIGDQNMSGPQLARAAMSRLQRTRGATSVVVLYEGGRFYAPIDRGAVIDLIDDRPELLVGVYRMSVDVLDLADDIDEMRRAA